MPEWQLEIGIGESRAILADGDTILAARRHWHGELLAGTVTTATLIAKAAGSRRGTARLADGTEILVDRLDKSAAEGGALPVEITRSAIGERGRLKMAQARPTSAAAKSLTLLDTLRLTPYPVRAVRRFSVAGWTDIVSDSLTQSVTFNGGSLLLAPTPAMLVIDIDGTLPPRDLALAAVPAISQAIRLFDIGGMIGVDFPTLENKADRRAIDDAIEAALTGWPHERTAMNGFGFVQLVARLERPSLIHRTASSRTGVLVRQLLRQAEHLGGTGAVLLSVHPALKAQLKPDWLEELARRTGRMVRIEVSPAIALEGSFAQSVPL